MPLTVILGVTAIAVGVFLLTWILLSGGRSRLTRENLIRGLQPGLKRQHERGSRLETKTLSMVVRAVTPASAAHRLERWLSLMGGQAWSLERVLLAKLLLLLLGMLVGLGLALRIGTGIGYLLGLALAVMAYFVPDLLVYSRGQKRQKQINRELADTLDQLRIAVDAGLGFDIAVSHVINNAKGPLAEELVRTLQDMQLGLSRREAYQALVQRTNVTDLGGFVRAVIQADMYGIPISTVLRTQAEEMRTKRRQRIEEQAMKIPVKVTFPLTVFILPVLFIVVLGPLVMSLF